MASKEHQILVNSLAQALEDKEGITITHVDIDNDPQYFDEKYKNLSTPPKHGDHIPDLQGKKDGMIHLGEAEIDLNDSNVDAQLKGLSNRVMKGADTPVPFHIIVPKSLKDDLYKKLGELGLNDKVKSGQIHVWS